MTGTIIKVIRPEGGFTVLPNETINDSRLSPEALGVLLRLASKPADWEIRARAVEKENRIKRDKRRRIFRELQAAGYSRRWRTRLATGQCIQVTEVYTVSQSTTEGWFAGVGFTGVGKPTHLIKTKNKKTPTKKQPPPPTPSSSVGGGGDAGAGGGHDLEAIADALTADARRRGAIETSATRYRAGVLRRLRASGPTPEDLAILEAERARQGRREAEEREAVQRREREQIEAELARDPGHRARQAARAAQLRAAVKK